MNVDRAIVAAIDPGLMSGVAVVDFYPDRASIFDTNEIPFASVLNWAREVNTCYGNPLLHLVAEDFIVTVATAKKSFQPWSLYGIGIVRAVAAEHGREVTLQKTADAKAMINNDMLRRAGLWHRGGAGHANDALRHAALYAVRTLRWHPPYLLSDDT